MIRLAVRVPREHAEVVLAELTELAPRGLEEVDEGEIVEYALYGAEGELPDMGDVRAAAGGVLVEVRTSEVADDWQDRWRAFHEPVLISGRLHVRPPWCAPHGGEGVRELVVDPGRAFGTGAHGTTRLCLELLVALAEQQDAAEGARWRAGHGSGASAGDAADGGGGAALTPRPAAGRASDAATRGPALDLGCGSGVLAIAAAMLGWGPIHGLDHEEASVEATIANAAVAGAAVSAARFDLLRGGSAGLGPLDDGRPPLVLANLLRPLLLRVAADGFAGTAPGTLVASGLLVHEVDEVVAAFARHGLVEVERRDDGEWAAVRLDARR